MAFGGYFNDGFTKRSDQLDSKRLEIAKAFEEFKRLNPYATAQELNSYIDQIAGPNPYLRQGGGTKQAVEEIARRNKEAELETQRQRLSSEMDFQSKKQKELKERLYENYINFGDINQAKANVLNSLQLTPPGTEYEQMARPMFEGFIQDLDNQGLENEFVGRYFKDNEDLMQRTIEEFGDYNTFSSLLPNQGIKNSPAFRDQFDSRKKKFDTEQRQKMYGTIQQLAKDPNMINMYRSGQLEFIFDQLGPYADKNPEIRRLIEQGFQTQQQEMHRARRAEASSAAQQYAQKQSADMEERMRANVDIKSLPPNVGAAYRNIVSTYRANGAGANTALAVAVADLQDDDDISMEDAMNKILSAAGGTLIPANDYEKALADRYALSLGGPVEMTTATAFKNEFFGDSVNEGDVQKQVRNLADQTDKLSQSTDDYLAGKMSKFQSRFGPTAYSSHINDINQGIMDIKQTIQQIDGYLAYGENQINFLGTFGEDFRGMGPENRAAAEEEKRKLQEQVLQLQNRKAQVEVNLELANRRTNGELTNRDISDADVQLLADEVLRMGGNANSFTAPTNYGGRPNSPSRNRQGSNKIMRSILGQSGILAKDQRDRYGNVLISSKQEQQELINRILAALR